MTRLTLVVPVKADSERVPSKNTRKFSDTSLVELKLAQLSKCKSDVSVVVSTNSSSVMEIAESFGFHVHARSESLCTATVPMSDVYRSVASDLDGDNIGWINVTNPLITPDIYDDAINGYLEMDHERYDCYLSAVEEKTYFYYKDTPINFSPTPWPRSQDLEPLVSLPFAFSFLPRKCMIQWGSCVGSRPKFHTLKKELAWDIDENIDFEFCEFLYKKNSTLTDI